MKILYVGNAQGLSNIEKYYLTENRLINGFIRLDHNVFIFNDRDHARYSSFLKSQSSGKKKMNARLIDSCRSFKPNLIMLSHCKNVTNKTLLQIKSLLPDVKIAYTNVDPLSVEQNRKDIFQRVNIADAIFITTGGEGLEQFNKSHASCYYFPNPVDPSIDTRCAFKNNDADIDVLFLGSALRHQQDHREVLAQHLLKNNKTKLNIHVGGLGINENKLYGTDYFDILSRSKMGICVNKTSDHYLYASDRMSHYMAAGVLAFIPKGPDFESILGKDTFVSFSSATDLLEKLVHYKNHPEEQKAIAENGYNMVHTLFEVNNVCRFMLDIIFEKKSSEDIIWHNQDREKRLL